MPPGLVTLAFVLEPLDPAHNDRDHEAWMSSIAHIRSTPGFAPGDWVMKIDADELRPELPQEYGRLVELWENGALVPFGDYASRHGVALAAAPDGTYLRFGKSPAFAADLVPVTEIDVAEICADWDGVKCVYRIDARAAQVPRAPPPRIDRGT